MSQKNYFMLSVEILKHILNNLLHTLQIFLINIYKDLYNLLMLYRQDIPKYFTNRECPQNTKIDNFLI